MRILARILLNAIAIAVAAWFVPGLHLSSGLSALAAGAILGIVNVSVKPLLIILTLPFTLITFGLFLFVVNAVCLGATAAVVPGFDIDGFWPALLGALLVTVVSWILNGVIFDSGQRRG